MADLALVVNPAIRRGSIAAQSVRIRLGRRASIVVIEEPSVDATRDAVGAAIASGAGSVVAIGGDGLVHALLPALARTDVPLGIVPAGTGNDLAAALGVPQDPMRAADVIAAGSTRLIDLGRSVDRWWASVLCAGFDSAINERANGLRWPRGRWRYDAAVLAELAQLRPRDFVVDVDGVRISGPTTLVAIGNTSQYGGGYRMCPRAQPDDGEFDVTIVGPVGRLDLARMLSAVKTGTHLGHPAVRTLRGRRVRIDATGTVAYADGERIGDLPIPAVCEAGSLRVFAPERE
ncbi:MAG: diacylglycerol/lipid kinase family protein [Mycobacteriales bacterium]|nr:MAG: sphingosine kinase [Pseudonocardiales bacterium]